MKAPVVVDSLLADPSAFDFMLAFAGGVLVCPCDHFAVYEVVDLETGVLGYGARDWTLSHHRSAARGRLDDPAGECVGCAESFASDDVGEFLAWVSARLVRHSRFGLRDCTGMLR